MLAAMQTRPIMIDGIAGPVVVESNFFDRCKVTVNGVPVTGRRRRFPLPTTEGRTIEARVRTTLVDPHPVIEIGPERYRTGPEVPKTLQLLTVLPFGAIMVGVAGAGVGGMVGGIVAGAGVAVNQAISRSTRSTWAKGALMVVVSLVAVQLTILLGPAFLESLR